MNSSCRAHRHVFRAGLSRPFQGPTSLAWGFGVQCASVWQLLAAVHLSFVRSIDGVRSISPLLRHFAKDLLSSLFPLFLLLLLLLLLLPWFIMTLRTLNYWNYGIFLIMGNAGFCPSTVREPILLYSVSAG